MLKYLSLFTRPVLSSINNSRRISKKVTKQKKKSMTDYGSPSFWDDRYTSNPEYYDWYQKWADLKEILAKHLPSDSYILNIGCGTSALSEDMIEDGYQRIMNIDISAVAVDIMKERFQEMNVLQMDSTWSEKFDAVIDKGTLDALLCGDNSFEKVEQMCTEIYRVMKPGGVFIDITYGHPDSRLQHFKKPKFNWTVESEKIVKQLVATKKPKADDWHYVYIMKKK